MTLSDVQGQPVTENKFKPQDYLPKGTHPGGLMQPGQPVDVKLELADPGENAVNFQFEFL